MILVIGNGKSRESLDLSKNSDTKIGCNAAARDLTVDHLVCCDRRMVKESLIIEHSSIYTRSRWSGEFSEESVKALPELPYEVITRPDDPWHWGSGSYAVHLATTLGDDIKLIGFDLYGLGKDMLHNNIYSDTVNYKSSTSKMVDPSYWIHQIATVFKFNEDKTFTIYQNKDWRLPEQWEFSNVSLDTLDNFS